MSYAQPQLRHPEPPPPLKPPETEPQGFGAYRVYRVWRAYRVYKGGFLGLEVVFFFFLLWPRRVFADPM